MKYLLDTSAIMHFIKGDAVFKYLTQTLDILNTENQLSISIVTHAELRSIMNREPLDRKKQIHYDMIFPLCKVIPIDENIVSTYVEIDTFSYGLHTTKVLEEPVEKMGKNDLWIAATAHALDMQLITIDSDFNHLDGEFIKLILLSIKGKLLFSE